MILEQHDFVMLPLLLLLFSFGKLGDEWFEDQEVTDELEAFTMMSDLWLRPGEVC